MFGFSIPAEEIIARGTPRMYWGARGIYTPSQRWVLDIPMDRAQFTPDPGNNFSMLGKWVRETGYPQLLEKLKSHYLPVDSGEVITIKQRDYTLMASPQRSYGYLYIGAWRYDPVKDGTLVAQYELGRVPEEKKWSGAFPVPTIGQKVKVTMNSMGTGTVLDYFWEHGFLGVRVILDKPPKWFREQNNSPVAMVFGTEILQVS